MTDSPINQAANTTTGNWRARICGEFYDQQGRRWRVEFIDSDVNGYGDFGLSSVGCHEVNLGDDGFRLSWDGPTDHIGAGVVPSSCEVTFVMDSAGLELVKSAIRDANDARFGLAIYFDDGGTSWRPWWVGTLNHEAIEYELQDLPYLFTVRASCGLNRLRNVPFNNAGVAFVGKKTLAELVAICLNKIPTANFWLNTQDQLKEVVDMFHTNQAAENWTSTDGALFPTTMLEQTFTTAEAFYTKNEGREDDFGRRAHYNKNFNSCFDVLEHITNAFGGRIFLNDFSFWFLPPNAMNWSTTLNVQKWTRQIVAGGTIRRSVSGSNQVVTSTAASVNFKTDIETDHALGEGWANSYLLPVKRAVLTHKEAGSQTVFGNSGSFFYIDHPNNGYSGRTFTNPDMVVSEGQTLNLSGLYDTGELIREFGSAVTGTAYNTHGIDRIGARIILRFKVKVGGLYYVSEHTMDSQTTNIDFPFGTQPDVDFKEVNFPNPVWQAQEGFYEIAVPWTNSNPEASVETHDGWSRIGGLHIKATGNNEFEYRINDTQDRRFEQAFDITTAPLPSTASTYSGVDITLDRLVITRIGAVRETFPQLDDIFTTSYAVQYDHLGNSIAPNFESAPADFVTGFRVVVDSTDEDADVEYFTEVTENTEYLDLGETVVGVSETTDGLPNASGALYTFTNYVGTTTVLSGDSWHSITDTIDNDFSGAHNLEVVVRETILQRGRPLMTQRGQIVPKVGTSNNNDPLDFTTAFAHNCSTTGDVEDVLLPLALSFTAGPCVYDLNGVLLSRSVLSFEDYNDPVRPFHDGGFGNNGGGNGQGNPHGLTDFVRATDAIETVNDEVTSIQTKTDLITVANAVDLDQVTTDIGNNASNITSAVNTANSAIGIANTAAAQSATAIQASTNNGAAITSLSLIAATNATDITAIETKTDNITVSQAVDLDDIETQATRLKNVSTSPSTPRMIAVGTSGDFEALTDGTSGQVLTTDGQGRYTFTTVSGGSSTDTLVLASHSGQFDLTTGRVYYLGHSNDGWAARLRDTNIGASSPYSISPTLAHLGIVAPKGLTSLDFVATVKNVDSGDNIKVAIFTGARPNGSNSNISLSKIGEDTVTITQGRHFNAGFRLNSQNIAKGDLVFVGLYRDSRTSTSTDVQISYTVAGA